MDKWLKAILLDKDPHHNLGRDQMRKKDGPEFECLCYYIRDLFRRGEEGGYTVTLYKPF